MYGLINWKTFENTQNKTKTSPHIPKRIRCRGSWNSFRSQVDAINKASSSPATPPDISCTMVVGGQSHLATLLYMQQHNGPQWALDNLAAVHHGTYIKSTSFNDFLYTKFASKLGQNTAVALLRSIKLNEGDHKVWATSSAQRTCSVTLATWGVVSREAGDPHG